MLCFGGVAEVEKNEPYPPEELADVTDAEVVLAGDVAETETEVPTILD